MRSLGLLTLLTTSALVAQNPQVSFLVGRVVGPEGKFVHNAVVAAIPPNGNWDGAATVRSDPEGRFRIGVKPGPYSLTATLPGLKDAFLGNLLVKADQGISGLTLQMERGGHRVSGQIVDQEGNLVKDCHVAFIRVSQDEGDVFLAHMNEGRFEVTLSSGNYVLDVVATGWMRRKEQVALKGDLLNKRISLVPGPSEASPEVKHWVKTHAIPLTSPEPRQGFKDMIPLKAVVGSARVVSLGEATHGTREFFQMKHRIFEFLVEQMGFTVFAIEANMPEARILNEYVTEGKGDPTKGLAGLYFWTWDTEEVLGLVRWMRSYNEDPLHIRKVKFYGFDMQMTPVAYKEVKGYLSSVDQEGLVWLETNLAEFGHSREPLSTTRGEKNQAARAATVELLNRFDTKRTTYIKSSNLEAFTWARQNARVMAQYAEMVGGTNESEIRDRCMAENVQWILNHEVGQKAVIWAHNGHVSSVSLPTVDLPPMGMHLRAALGKDILNFGFVFRGGGFQARNSTPRNNGLQSFEVAPNPKATLSEALSSAGLPLLALDLRTLPAQGVIRRWFNSPQGAIELGAVYSTHFQDSYLINRNIAQSFDALCFIERTTPARANPSGRRPNTIEVKPD